MPNSNHKPKAMDYSTKLRREAEVNRREYKEFLEALAEIASRPHNAALLAEVTAKTGNPIGIEVLLWMCEELVENGHDLPRNTRAHLMEHARMTPEQRKRLLSSLDLN